MSGKAKSCYLTVADKFTHKAVLRRMFFKMGDLNDFIKTEYFKEKYPENLFIVIKEVYCIGQTSIICSR